MLLFVFFTFKISFIKKNKNKNKNCPDNLNCYTTEVDIISIIIKTTSLRAIAYLDIAVGFPCMVPSDDGISVLPIIKKRDGRV